MASIEAFLALFGPLGAIFGVGVRFKKFFWLTYEDNQLWFWKCSPIFFILIRQHLGPLFQLFGPFGAIFLALWGFFWVRVRFTHLFGNFWCSLLIVVLELEHYFFSIRLTIFHLFGTLRVIFWVIVRFKNFFGTYLCKQLTLVLEVQPYLFVFTSAKFGAFLHFWGLSGLFLGLGSGSKTFWGPTHID